MARRRPPGLAAPTETPPSGHSIKMVGPLSKADSGKGKGRAGRSREATQHATTSFTGFEIVLEMRAPPGSRSPCHLWGTGCWDLGSVCLALSRNLDKSSSPGSPITPRLVTWWKLGALLSGFKGTARYARGSPRQGDKSAIWQVIRRLAPKTAKTRVQLRGPKGELLTQQEETDRFVAYCQKVYHAPPEPAPLPTDLALVSPRPLPDSSAQFDQVPLLRGAAPLPFDRRRTRRPLLLFPALCRRPTLPVTLRLAKLSFN